MSTLFIDIETFSSVDLPKTGVYRYAESPDFKILMAGWALDDSPVRLALDEDSLLNIPGLFDPSVLKVAHNAQFERVCFSRFLGLPTDTFLSPTEWHDTQAVAAEFGYPQKLLHLAKALGVDPKDEAGVRLINLFSKPNRKGERNDASSHPMEWKEFEEYCRQDVVTLRQVHQELGDFPTEVERAVFLADQRINDRGMKIDLDLAQQAADIAADNAASQILQVRDITGVANPNSRDQMLKWLGSRMEGVEDLRADTVTRLLGGPLEDDVRRVLTIRQELALAAPKKFTSALQSTSSDGRLRGGFKFFGAHTGRWAGRGLQPHNLPRATFTTEEEIDDAIDQVMILGAATTTTLKELVRPLFLGPLTVVDFSSIEARVLAWIAGESWSLEAFAAGQDVYAATAIRMGMMPPGTDPKSPEYKAARSKGKVAVLALGYGGGPPSLRALGYGGDRPEDEEYRSDEELWVLVNQWRDVNSHICAFWKTMDAAFRLGGPVGDLVHVEAEKSVRRVHLPSGRSLTYRGVTPKWVTVTRKDGSSVRKRQITFVDPKFPWGGAVHTYGGRLAENVTQAIARDVLAEALVRLVEKGVDVVGHVHDEVLMSGDRDLDAVTRIITESPEWADGLPLSAEGFTTSRYRKG